MLPHKNEPKASINKHAEHNKYAQRRNAGGKSGSRSQQTADNPIAKLPKIQMKLADALISSGRLHILVKSIPSSCMNANIIALKTILSTDDITKYKDCHFEQIAPTRAHPRFERVLRR
jgi:hypothetical protein